MSLIITDSTSTPTNDAAADENNVGDVLDINVATRIAGALDQLNQLDAQKVLTPTTGATKRALEGFINQAFRKHGGELLGAFFSLKGEYEPLIGSLAILFRRVNATINHMRAQESAHREAVIKAAQPTSK